MRPMAFGFIVMALAISCGALSARSTVRTIEVLDVLVLLLIVAIPDIGFYILAIAMPVAQTKFGINAGNGEGSSYTSHRLPRRANCRAPNVPATDGDGSARSRTSLLLPRISNPDRRRKVPAQGHTWNAHARLRAIEHSADRGPNLITRRATVVFAFSAVCVALVEIPTARSSLAASANISAVNSAASSSGPDWRTEP